MKVKFKDLRNSRIKIDKFHECFGQYLFIEMCNYYNLTPRHCANNAWKLSNCAILENIDFEFVECIMRYEHNGEQWITPHAISYWNGHYFDFTLEIADVFNKIQDNILFLKDNNEILPVRRYKKEEIQKLIRYAKENDENIGITYVCDNIWVDKNGKVQMPYKESPWIDIIDDGLNIKCCKESDFKKYMY